MRPRVAPAPASSDCTDGEPPGFPICSLPRLRRLAELRVAPALAPFGGPQMRLRVAPAPASTSGSMMTPRLDSNFASSAELRMNLRFQPGSAHSCLNLDAISISMRLSTAGKPALNCLFQPDFASSFQAGTAFPFPAGSPTGCESRSVLPVEASAKNRLICGFHQCWCINRRSEDELQELWQ